LYLLEVAVWKGWYKMHPVGRIDEPEDVSLLAVHLTSETPTFATELIIVSNGERTSRLPLPF
jgi:hypothetical protein